MRQVTCTNGRWSVSSTTGTDIPSGFAVINVSRHYGRKIARGQLDGLIVPCDTVHSLMLEYGYVHYYSRNNCRFVMSRAARKRGYTTDDYRYTSARRYYQCH